MFDITLVNLHLELEGLFVSSGGLCHLKNLSKSIFRGFVTDYYVLMFSARPRSLVPAPEPRNEEGPIGLAAIM